DPIREFAYVDRLPDREAAKAVDEIMDKLHKLDPEGFFGKAGPNDYSSRRALRFDDDGQKVFRAWYSNMQAQLRTGSLDDALPAHLGKYPGLFARLAAVHHLIRYVSGDAAPPALVDGVTARAVAGFIDNYLASHARRIYRSLGHDPARDGAKRIA